MLRTLRNVAIIAVLAVPLAFVPGGGNAADAVLVTLGMAFLATIAIAARQIHRENRLTFDSLPDDQRAVLLLRVIGDLSIEDVAKAVGKRPGAVKALQRRGLAAVKRELTRKGVSL